MGWVDLPDAPPRGGRMSATLVLERQELTQTVDLLKAALAEFTKDIPNGLPLDQPNKAAAARIGPAQAAPKPAAAPQAAPVPVPLPAAFTPAAAHVPAVPVAQPRMPAQPAASAPTPAAPPAVAQFQQQQQYPQQAQPRQQQPQAPPAYQQQQPQGPPAYQQQQLPRVPVPAAVPMPVPVAVPQPQQQQPRPQQQQQQYQQPYAAAPRPAATDPWSGVSTPAAVPAPAAPAAPAAANSRWQLAFASDAEDHANATVSALAYAQALPGLPGGDGHAGWLVSGSKGMLNLWEANRAAAGDEMALLCMHSQAVDVIVSKLVLEPDTHMLFGASQASSDASECISVHSLDPQVGLLSMRYRFSPPPGRPRATQRLMQQVVSVHGMTPGLRSSIIASYGDRLLMFEAKPGIRANSVLHDASFHFVAHQNSVVTCLHRSSIEGSCALISGAQDGHIHLWDLKTPPKNNTPSMRMQRHTKSVTGLTLVSDDRLASSSLDGSVLLWDLRSPGSPLHSTTAPGGAGVLKIAPGPWGDVLAVSTAKGLHCLELFDFEAPMANIAPYPLPRPFSDVVFNMVTHDLYAGSGNGSIQVFSRLA